VPQSDQWGPCRHEVVEPTDHLQEHEAGALKGAWMLYQMRTTNDFAAIGCCPGMLVG
jgi:hypothetical protein